MRGKLTQLECRVIAVLLEKSATTPDQYPLTMNALTNGCNQKSNRDPVMSLSEDEVKSTVDSLLDKRLITLSTGFGSRVDKITQRFCNTEFSDIKLSQYQFAILTELMLRGPQTPGELRGRCQRLAPFKNLSDVEATLSSLLAYQPDPLVRSLPREPGKREIRYEHCLFESSETSGKTVEIADSSLSASPNPNINIESESEVEKLKADVASLAEEVESLRARLELIEAKQKN